MHLCRSRGPAHQWQQPTGDADIPPPPRESRAPGSPLLRHQCLPCVPDGNGHPRGRSAQHHHHDHDILRGHLPVHCGHHGIRHRQHSQLHLWFPCFRARCWRPGQQLGATLFSSYAGFNVAYALIFIPGTGVLAAYTDTATGKPLPELNQALALLVWAWFILSLIFTIAATRASWSLLLALVFFDLETMLLAVGYTVGNDQILLASRGVGFVVAFCGCQYLALSTYGLV